MEQAINLPYCVEHEKLISRTHPQLSGLLPTVAKGSLLNLSLRNFDGEDCEAPCPSNKLEYSSLEVAKLVVATGMNTNGSFGCPRTPSGALMIRPATRQTAPTSTASISSYLATKHREKNNQRTLITYVNYLN
jgi:hypothetical protein